MNIPFNYAISNSGVISVNVKGRMVPFAPDHPHYSEVKEAIGRKDMEAIERFANIPQAIQNYTGLNVQVRDGNVFYKGKVVANSLTKRIITLMREGFPFEPMLLFLDNLMQNTSHHAVQELYNFLQNRNLPITEDGCFLAYKSITLDNLDWYSRTIKNEVGTVVSVPRNEVDDNWRQECSSGLHVGAIEYVKEFHANAGKIIIVKVNPRDVVACEGSFQKCRTCEYTIVGEMTEELASSIYMATTAGFSASTPQAMAAVQPPAGTDVVDDDDDTYSDDDDDLLEDEEEDEEEEEDDEEYD